MRKILTALPALLLASCMPHAMDMDPIEVSERYAFRNPRDCHSWLRSPTTGHEYCASPAFAVDAKLPPEIKPKRDETKTDKASLMEVGEEVYGQVCAACHQADGKGQGDSFPPLAGSGDYYGGPKKMAGIILNGLNGEIVVQGRTYNGAMPAQGEALSDYEIAAVATYVRNSWGNNDGIVKPEVVAEVRGK